jgi:hypothetical protein
VSGFFASGRFADVVLAFVVLEACALFFLHRFVRQGPGLVPMLPTLAAGACLVVAVRLAMTGGTPVMLATALLGALVAHLADLGVRWRC